MSARCRECGWLIERTGATRCASCGSDVGAPPPPAARIEASALLATHDEDYPGLRDAFNAYRGKEWQRYVAICIAATGAERPFTGTVDNAQVWAFQHRSAVILLWLDRTDHTLAIDAPLVDIRPETEAALLRTTLSMSDQIGGARFARRGDRLLLTMSHRIEAMSPPRLVGAMIQIAEAADALDNSLAFEFGVRLLGSQLRRGHVYHLAGAGVPRALRTVTGATRPVALAPNTARGPRRDTGAVVTASTVARFLEVVREAQQLTVALGIAGSNDVEPAVQVAMALRAALAGGLELDASRQLLRQAMMIRAGTAPASSMRPIYLQLLADRGLAPPQAAASWPRIPGESAKASLRRDVMLASRSKIATVRRTVLLGALCELVLFCDLPAAKLDQLRELHDRSQATDSATIEGLFNTLESISR